MRLAAPLLLALVAAGCATLAPPSMATTRPQLSTLEAAVAESALRAEIDSYQGKWPVVLLDDTSPWMPQGDDEPAAPAGVPHDDWLAQNPPVPVALRAANAESYSLGAIGAAVGAQLYPRSQLESMERSKQGLRALAKRFSGREPAVLEISRPSINDRGEAHILVHVYNSWNGCGSINMYVARQTGSEWASELQRVLVIW